MEDLITTLLSHKTAENEEIVDELVDYINEENIISLEDLEAFEDRMFTFDGECLNTKQRISHCYVLVENAYYDYEGLSLQEIKDLQALKNSVNVDHSDTENILTLIKIYSITNRELMFLREAYEFIINGLL